MSPVSPGHRIPGLGLITRRSRVQIPPPLPPKNPCIARVFRCSGGFGEPFWWGSEATLKPNSRVFLVPEHRYFPGRGRDCRWTCHGTAVGHNRSARQDRTAHLRHLPTDADELHAPDRGPDHAKRRVAGKGWRARRTAGGPGGSKRDFRSDRDQGKKVADYLRRPYRVTTRGTCRADMTRVDMV